MNSHKNAKIYECLYENFLYGIFIKNLRMFVNFICVKSQEQRHLNETLVNKTRKKIMLFCH